MNAVLSNGSPEGTVGSAQRVGRGRRAVDAAGADRIPSTERLCRRPSGQWARSDRTDCDLVKPWLVLTDLKMPRSGGLEVVKEVKKRCPNTHVVVMTAYGTVETAVEAMKCGAIDYLLKPFATEQLEQVLVQLEAGSCEDTGMETVPSFSRSMLGEDPAMTRVLALAEGVAMSQATVLVQGESGTGKELLARFFHSRSPRGHRPFIAVNCAALPDGLLESELFGHERGAFTGALVRKQGKFEMAHQGTILLDEISEMNLGLQAKLLRVLQEREVDRIGGREPI